MIPVAGRPTLARRGPGGGWQAGDCSATAAPAQPDPRRWVVATEEIWQTSIGLLQTTPRRMSHPLGPEGGGGGCGTPRGRQAGAYTVQISQNRGEWCKVRSGSILSTLLCAPLDRLTIHSFTSWCGDFGAIAIQCMARLGLGIETGIRLRLWCALLLLGQISAAANSEISRNADKKGETVSGSPVPCLSAVKRISSFS